jgi:hypothetical protein
MIWIAAAVSAISLLAGLFLWIFAKPLSEKLNFQEAHQNKNFGIFVTVIGVVLAIVAVIGYFKFEEVGMDTATDLAAIFTFIAIFIAVGFVLALAFTIFSFTNHSKTAKSVVSLLLTIALLGGLICIAPHTLLIKSNDTEDVYGNSDSDVYFDAISVVKKQLKSPSSAEFSSRSSTSIKLSSGTSSWTVSGWVEAENGFGATVRNEFQVRLTYQNKGDYAVVSCNIS